MKTHLHLCKIFITQINSAFRAVGHKDEETVNDPSIISEPDLL
jgi:hypothetical protein